MSIKNECKITIIYEKGEKEKENKKWGILSAIFRALEINVHNEMHEYCTPLTIV